MENTQFNDKDFSSQEAIIQKMIFYQQDVIFGYDNIPRHQLLKYNQTMKE